MVAYCGHVGDVGGHGLDLPEELVALLSVVLEKGKQEENDLMHLRRLCSVLIKLFLLLVGKAQKDN